MLLRHKRTVRRGRAVLSMVSLQFAGAPQPAPSPVPQLRRQRPPAERARLRRRSRRGGLLEPAHRSVAARGDRGATAKPPRVPLRPTMPLTTRAAPPHAKSADRAGSVDQAGMPERRPYGMVPRLKPSHRSINGLQKSPRNRPAHGTILLRRRPALGNSNSISRTCPQMARVAQPRGGSAAHLLSLSPTTAAPLPRRLWRAAGADAE